MFLTLFLISFCLGQQRNISITITENGGYKLSTSTLDPSADIIAYFIDSMETTGWGILEIKTNTNKHSYTVTDDQLMYYAGVAEGYLTSNRISETFNNTCSSVGNYCNGANDNLKNYINTQQKYQQTMYNNNKNNPFWIYANLLNKQLNGLYFGYNMTAKQKYNDIFPILYLNIIGDLFDIPYYYDKLYEKYTFPDDYIKYRDILEKFGHCSALIKITPEIDDIFVGHSSWFTYENTNRIFKHYIFELNMKTATKHMAFSSYPGYLESLDDYYLMDSGLVMLQTTNSVPNVELHKYITPNSLYAWQRVRIANALARSGYEWYEMLNTSNSGTYNNQYMIVDMNLFKPNQPLSDNLLWVIEQIPGYVAGEDKTNVLERGYWASYNVPALESIYNKSGYPELVAITDPSNSYDLAPRARIFRRDSNNVNTLDDYLKIMRYNNYKNDAIENNNPSWAIMARGDLSTNGRPSGGYDTKGANLTMILNMETIVKNGPTSDNLPPFNWNDWPQYKDKHVGIPDLMDFDWQYMKSIL